jgi:putative NADH-flavin reductase
MKIIVFGATGWVGRHVVTEALQRGHEVVGVVRDPAAVTAPDSRVTVVSAISPRPNSRGLPAPSLEANSRALIAGLRAAGGRRVLYVGGASSQEVAPGQALAVQPDFPEAYRTEAREGRDARAVWRREAQELDWTYLSPAAEIAPGERTGTYRTSGDQLLVDANGKSFISFEDYAVAVLDELEHPTHIGQRFGVAY